MSRISMSRRPLPRRSRLRTLVLVGTGIAETYGALQWLGRAWGSSREERQRTVAGDALVPRPQIVTDHAIDIQAPPEAVWPWLLQVGWHRGGWYTHRWVDRLLFPANAPSAQTILPEYQNLKVGDAVPDGPPESECAFIVDQIDRERALVLFSRAHLPPSMMRLPGVELAWSWAFLLEPRGEAGTRFHIRTRLALRPWWLRWAYALALVPADFVMARSMCRGLRERAERLAQTRTHDSPPE